MTDGSGLRFGPVRPWGLSWIAPTPPRMFRASHALVAGGRLWLVDPVDGPGLDGRLAPLAPVAGVIQLLDRHNRDCAAVAERHGVAVHANPLRGVPGTPFIPIPLTQRRWWQEVALWWPEHRALVVAEAVGTSPYLCAPGEPLGVHPALRLFPPRALFHLHPRVLLPGHGPPLEGGAVDACLLRALRRSRRELPRYLAGLPRAGRAPDAEPLPPEVEPPPMGVPA